MAGCCIPGGIPLLPCPEYGIMSSRTALIEDNKDWNGSWISLRNPWTVSGLKSPEYPIGIYLSFTESSRMMTYNSSKIYHTSLTAKTKALPLQASTSSVSRGSQVRWSPPLLPAHALGSWLGHDVLPDQDKEGGESYKRHRFIKVRPGGLNLKGKSPRTLWTAWFHTLLA